MKNAEVKVNEVYVAKIGGNTTLVKVTGIKSKGFNAVNLKTNREINLKTAGKLRKHIPEKLVSVLSPVYL